MTAPPLLFDAPARALRLARARGIGPALFLHETVADGMQERHQEVNRTFTDVAVVTDWPEVWAARFPGARVVVPGDVLDIAPQSFDLVVHALALHAANDPVGQLAQCRLALRPDGLMLAALFGGQTLHELRACLAEAETVVTGGLSPRITPMGEIRDLGGLIGRAGLALPVADAETFTVSYGSAFHLMRDLRAMGEANTLVTRLRRPTRRAVFARAAEIYAARFAGRDGRIRATFEVVTLTGWAPSANQPKPLRPGSATQRLADVLGSVETPPESDAPDQNSPPRR